MEFIFIMTWGSDVVPQLIVGWALSDFLPTGWRLVEDDLGAHTISPIVRDIPILVAFDLSGIPI